MDSESVVDGAAAIHVPLAKRIMTGPCNRVERKRKPGRIVHFQIVVIVAKAQRRRQTRRRRHQTQQRKGAQWQQQMHGNELFQKTVLFLLSD